MLTQNFMRVFFRLLYHPFAFAYDLIAATVSFGYWKNWVFEIIPFIKGNHILELGHGPGHLQRALLALNLESVALDESAQMGSLAKRKLGGKHQLARAVAQRLPFANNSFDTVVATFPTEYIFDARTLSEIGRCLRNRGKLVVMPVAYPRSGFLRWLYKITGETPSALEESFTEKITRPFIHAGFATEAKIIEVKSGTLLVVIATNIK